MGLARGLDTLLVAAVVAALAPVLVALLLSPRTPRWWCCGPGGADRAGVLGWADRPAIDLLANVARPPQGAVAGGGVVDAVSDGAIGRGAAVTAPGLMVMAIILFMGAVSGAHLNPAVTLGFALRGDFPWRRVPGYIIAELLGSTLAVLLLWAMFGKVGSLGATEPGAGISDVQAMVMELVLTVGLFSVIIGTASKAQNLGPLSALGVGAYIVLAGLWSSPISGASMNPARSFGPDLVMGNFDHYWVYVVGPILGVAIAVGFAFILRGRADVGGAAAAQGALGPLRVGPDPGAPGRPAGS